MFNVGKYNKVPFNRLVEVEVHYPTAVQNDLTMMFDTDIIPVEYIGEQLPYANSPWMPQNGFYPNQWLVGRDLNLYFAGNDGFVHQFGVGKTDNGKPIKSHYVVSSITLGVLDRKKRVRWIDFDAEKARDSFVRVWYKLDDEDEWHLLCELNQGERIFPFANFPKVLFRKISLKFENAYTGCHFIINGFSLDMIVHGQQRELI